MNINPLLDKKNQHQLFEREDERYEKIDERSCEVEVAEMLYSLTRIIKPKVVIETGSYEGYSTIAIMQALKDNKEGHLYSIDVVHEVIKQNIKEAKLEDYITYMTGDSLIMGAKLVRKLERIDYVHIDAVHTYDFATKEIETFFPKLTADTGYMSFHDTWHRKFRDKVGKAVDNAVKKYNIERIRFKSARGLDIIRKRGNNE